MLTQLPVTSQAATKKFKFIKVEKPVIAPSLGETAKITWNLQNTHVVNVMIMRGDEIIAYLAKNKEYKGGYVPYELSWNGKDLNGNDVESGTYRVVVEPQDKARKYKSIAEVSVVTDLETEIAMLPNLYGDTFVVYGKGGRKQGVTDVALSVTGGDTKEKAAATVGNSFWFAKLPMTDYTLYQVSAAVSKDSGSSVESLSAVRHTMRTTDRLEYLGGFYYKDYKKDTKIIKENHLAAGKQNRGYLVGASLLMVNPSDQISQGIKENEAITNQHLGLIDQIEQLSGSNLVNLSMGNNFLY